VGLRFSLKLNLKNTSELVTKGRLGKIVEIIKTHSRKTLEHNQKNDDFISEVIDRIFLICREDENFNEADKLNSIDEKISLLREKINKQDQLLVKSKQMKVSLKRKMDELDNGILSEKAQLLESLGSEI